ncbi:MAG: hypothetical protein LBR76_01335 [Oscillospiraceae bacterium]|jgi:hypothetical protein|nr:hypothetical protein [Oscillospiraceae bacterium]
MMYPFLQLEDGTEIVHSEILENGDVRVYIEKPIEGGFQSAFCILPEYRWEEIHGFSEAEIGGFLDLLESAAHLIIRFAREGGFEGAANF